MPTLDETLQHFTMPWAPPSGSDGTVASALAALGAVMPLSPEEESQIEVGPPPPSNGYQSTNLMAPGQDPAAYDLANPPQPRLPDRILGLGGGPMGDPNSRAPEAGLRTGPDFPVGVDTVGAERGEPDLSDTAGYDPNAPTFTPPGTPRTPAEADAQVADQTSRVAAAYQAAAKAKMDADTARATAQADVLDRSAKEQELANHQYQQSLLAAKSKSDGETAAWMQEMENKAKEEPLPGRWWHNQSRLGQALWGLSLLFGSGSAALTPGARNAALDMVRENIRNDMEEQRARNAREISTLKMKGEVMRSRQDRDRLDLKDEHSQAMTRVQALERAWTARTMVPGAADQAAAAADAQLFFEKDLKLPLVEDFRKQRYASYEAGLSRAHAERMQQQAQNFQAEQARLRREFDERENDKERGLRLALAPVKEAVSFGAGGMPLDKEGKPLYRRPISGIGSPSGLLMLGPDGKPLNGTGVYDLFTDEQVKETNALTAQANKKYDLMVRLANKLDEGSRKGGLGDKVPGVAVGVFDPETESLMKQLGYLNAKEADKGGKVTDADFNNGLAAQVGFNPDGSALDRGKFALNYEDIRKMVHKQIADYPHQITGQLSFDQTLVPQGSRPVWDPQSRAAPEVEEQNAQDIKGSQGVRKPIMSVKDYQRARKTEDADVGSRGLLLPKHDKAMVDAFIATTNNRAPSTVHATAKETLDKLKAREDALESRLGDPNDPWNGSTFADQDAADKARRTLDNLKATSGLIRNLEADAATRQAKKLDNFRKQAEQVWDLYGASEDNLRGIAHTKYDLTDAEEEVYQIIQDVRSKARKPRGGFVR